jgi:hypothetical protein
MLWKTHLRISFEVLNRLGISLSPETTQHFKEGIIAPDQWKDYPHHFGKSKEIQQHLMKARKYFLIDDSAKAFFHLGVALHYIQDSHTSFASFYPNHHRWEESIEQTNFTNHLKETINYSLKDKSDERRRCLWLAEALSEKAQNRDHTLHLATLAGHEQSKSFAKPIVDLNLALRASYIVTESVLSPKTCSALENKLSEGLSTYESLMITAERELAEKIIRLINERENLEKRKVPPAGFISKLKNGILTVRIKLKNLSAKSNYKSYTKRKHLEQVVRSYIEAANTTVAPHIGWYNFKIPKLNPKIVNRELLAIQEVTEILIENEETTAPIANLNVPTYHVGNSELIKRADIDNLLKYTPIA